MFVEDVRTEQSEGVVRFVATLRWEEIDREPVDVFFAVDEADAHLVGANTDSFRVPGAVVARHDREDRLSGGGPMCPVLHNGLQSSLEWLARWSGVAAPIPRIDVPLGCDHPTPLGSGLAASFVSGGVDSSAVLVSNHNAYEPDHPLRISIGIVVVGIQSNRWTAWTRLKDRLAAARQDLSWVSTASGIDVIPVATNIRALNDGGTFWKYEYQGAALAGVGHLFAKSVSNLSIASSWEIRNLGPWGSHPLLDSGYGSHSLRVWHELAHLGRLEKTRRIAAHSEMLEGLNVCNKGEAGDRNCGRCEKCLRTMLALEVLGLRDQAQLFVHPGIDIRDLRQVRILDRGLEGEYVELIEPLKRAGREDLARAVRRKVVQGRLIRRKLIGKVRAWGAAVLPRTMRERYLGTHRIPR